MSLDSGPNLFSRAMINDNNDGSAEIPMAQFHPLHHRDRGTLFSSCLHMSPWPPSQHQRPVSLVLTCFLRSVELEGSQALSQQAELISRQLRELRRLEEEVRVLRETSLQQKMRLEAQTLELEALARAEKAGRVEAEGLRAALAGAEVVRKNLEEGSQRDLEEVKRLHQEQVNVGVRRVQLHSGERGKSFPAKSRF